MNTLYPMLGTSRIYAITIAVLLSLLAATPPVSAQTTEATVDIIVKDNVLTINIQSPVTVARFQIGINTTTPYTLTPSNAKLTGFLEGATVLTNLNSSGFNHYRWFNLNAKAGQTGTLTLPVTPLPSGAKIILVRVDLQDSSDKAIPVSGTFPRNALISSTTTATTTVTSTALSTITSTATITAPAATVTRTETTTTGITSTSTVTSTATAPAATTTVTSTTTITGPPQDFSTTALAIIAVLAIIIILLLLRTVRRKR
ncbi:MAG: hypothetical protein HYX82_02250 [Chloroflexi bacterium]|nr:hypothetical protein [Chloroflexota bacterium]